MQPLPDDREESPAEVKRRADALIERIARASGARCTDCSRLVCGHEVVLGVISGYEEESRCADCLADAMGLRLDVLLERVIQQVEKSACYRMGWRWASQREGFDGGSRPRCLWPQDPTEDGEDAAAASGGVAGSPNVAADRAAPPVRDAE